MTEGLKEATATNLKRLRTEKNETQEDTAKAAGVSLSAYRAYENGERIPRDEVKIRLADHFGTTIKDIFFDGSSIEGNAILQNRTMELSPIEREIILSLRYIGEEGKAYVINALNYEKEQEHKRKKGLLMSFN